MTLCTKNVTTPCRNEATEILFVRASYPGAELETYYRCPEHPAKDDVRLIRMMSPLAAVKIVPVDAPTPPPCQCHQSSAPVTPTHPGHCCFVPGTQTCHPAEVAEWERQHALRHPPRERASRPDEWCPWDDAPGS